MRRKPGPKRKKQRYEKRATKPPAKPKKRPRRNRVCPVHGRVLVSKRNVEIPSWKCPEPGCDIRRGNKPTSTPCDAATGKARRQLHEAFDPLWQAGPQRRFSYRNRAYIWLAGELGVSMRQCHIGMFTIEMCARTQAAIRELLKSK